MKPSIHQFLPTQSSPPSFLVPWIACQASLTEKLKAVAGQANIEVLAQHWQLADWWDQQVLHLERQVVFRREIIMRSEETSCWYARTIIPETTYEANTPLFNRLKTESLGVLIFNEDAIKRVQLIYYPITNKSIEYYWLKSARKTEVNILWLRLSTLMLDVYPFFLIEILLPGLERYSN